MSVRHRLGGHHRRATAAHWQSAASTFLPLRPGASGPLRGGP